MFRKFCLGSGDTVGRERGIKLHLGTGGQGTGEDGQQNQKPKETGTRKLPQGIARDTTGM